MAVIARLEDVAAAQVDALIEALPDHHLRRRPPHVRLATYDDEVDVVGLDEALAATTRAWTKLSIIVVGIGLSPGDPCGLSLVPVPICGLLRWHLAADDTLIPVAGRHCFEHGIWSPLLTLGYTAFPADTVEVLTALWPGPMDVTLDRIEIVRIKSFEVISSHTLPG